MKIILDILMIITPTIGYIFQARKFEETKSSKGFSRTLCLLLLLSNILRIYFWFGKKFSSALLFQSIMVIISQIYLIHVYLKYSEISKDKKQFQAISLINWKETLTPSKIWNWGVEIEYYKFILFLFFIFGSMCYIIGNNYFYFYEIIGTISVSIETFIEIPQIVENYRTKNVKNISGMMVLMWFLGDLFRTTYNLLYKSPIQIIIGCIIQNFEDIILSSQILIFGDIGGCNKYMKKMFNYKFDKKGKEDDEEPIINGQREYELENNNEGNNRKDKEGDKIEVKLNSSEDDSSIDTNV